MNIDFIHNLIKDIKHPNARQKIIKLHITEEIIKQLGTDVMKEIDYCIYNNIHHVPTAYCGKKKKYHNGKFLSVCNNYILGDNNSCNICHAEKSRISTEKVILTSRKKYNTDFPNQNENVKKLISENSNFSEEQKQEINKKRKKTLRKNYGVENPMHHNELKNKQMKSISENKERISSSKRKAHMLKKYNMVRDRIPDTIKIINLYPNNKNYSDFLCTECNVEFKAKTYNKCTSIKCLKCHPNYVHISNGEKEVLEYIKSIYSGEIISNNRNIISPLELDIFIPEYNIAIEYNGSYYHSDIFRDKSYHQYKQQLCSDKGIKLISIFDYMWENDKELFKKKLKYDLSKSTRIYARKCIVKEIDNKTYNKFCNENHLQGSVNAKIKIGLYYNDELVSLMSFSTPRFNKQYEYELIRYCSSCSVVGGASKLLSYFERKYTPKNIISYANLCWSNGDVYKKLGFELKNISSPSYIYFKTTSDIITRYASQKHLISNDENSSMTEKEIMFNDGYKKIYDCGNAVYVKEYKNE